MKAFALETIVIFLFIVFRPGLSESPFLLSPMISNETTSTTISSDRTASNAKNSSPASSNGISLDSALTAMSSTENATIIWDHDISSTDPPFPDHETLDSDHVHPPHPNATVDHIHLPDFNSPNNEVSHPDPNSSNNQVSLPDHNSSNNQVSLPDHNSPNNEVSLPDPNSSNNEVSHPDHNSSNNEVSHPDPNSPNNQVSHPDPNSSNNEVSHPDPNSSNNEVSHPDPNSSNNEVSHPDHNSSNNEVSHPDHNSPNNEVSHPDPNSSNNEVSHPDHNSSNNQVSLPDRNSSNNEVSHPDHNSSNNQVSLPDHNSPNNQVSLRDPNSSNNEGDLPETDLNRHTIFQDLNLSTENLKRKIFGVEDRVCGNICTPLYSTAYTRHLDDNCQWCHCDFNCFEYGDCCPDAYLMDKGLYKDNNGFQCLETNLGSTWVIDKCPQETLVDINDGKTGKDFIQQMKCEQPDVSKLDEAVLVYDLSTQSTYTNVHCSRCHNAKSSNIRQWKLKVRCDYANIPLTYQYNKTELYSQIIKGELKEVCDINYDDESKNYVRDCNKPAETIITRCNQTGNLSPSFYDAEIDEACQMYTSVFKNEFKNMFCFMCNKNRFWSLKDMFNATTGALNNNVARVTFSALINLNSDLGSTNDNDDQYKPAQCSSVQIFDNATCSCKDITCTQLRNFDPETNTCPYVQFSGLSAGYRACLRVYVDYNKTPNASSIESLSDALSSLHPTIRLMVTMSQWCPGDTRLIIHLDTWALDGQIGEHGYAFEKTFDVDGNLFCDFIQKQQLHSDEMGNIESCEFEMVDKTECPAYNEFNKPCKLFDTFQVEPTVVVNFAPLKLHSYSEYHFEGNGELRTTINFEDRFIIPPYEVVKFKRDKPRKMKFLPYRRIEHCPFVDMPVGDLNVTGSTIVHRASLQSVKAMNVRFTQNDTVVSICLDDYLRWSLGDRRDCVHYGGANNYIDSSFDTWTIAGLISLVSTCISLFFLTLTFLTYLLFDTIRTRGGVSIMILTVLLFIAQALYEFAIEQYNDGIFCSLYGVLVHFFWLASIFSMNACSIERFIKLCFPLQSLGLFATKKSFVISMLYTFVCPLVIVGINIMVNVVTKNQFGYGSSFICYINGRYSRIFSFVVPMCVVLVINAVLLGITIIKLRHQSQVGGGKNGISGSKIGLVACVRLSIVTGGTWLISLLYEVVQVEALGYVFTAFLGLQGVIFFFSLLGNRRILDLYVQVLNARPRRTESTPNGTV